MSLTALAWISSYIHVTMLGLVFASDEDIERGLLMGLEYSHGLPCK